MDKAKLISLCGSIPVLGPSLRKMARRYPEGSIVTIKNGHLTGHRWQRSQRYVSGYWLGHYELPIQECLVRELKPGDVFYDIGANAGFFTLLGSKCVGPTGQVFAFDPLPENVHSVRSQLKLNGIENCSVVEAAVSDQQGIVKFSSGRDTSTAHLLGVKDDMAQSLTLSVQAITLDQFVKDAPAPDFIKMDIEGAEVLALKGASAILGSNAPPRMLIEFHGDEIFQAGTAILNAFDYDVLSMTREPFASYLCGRHALCVPRKHDHVGTAVLSGACR